ncbi:MAG: type II toxin-antitoxin system VapC family toxin [Mesorhizobium sp.]
MNYLLDTNVLSETSRPQPSPDVLHWLAELDEDRGFVSVITIAELRRGALIVAPGRRRETLLSWIDLELRDRFSSRIVPVDVDIADRWSDVMAASRAEGRGLGVMDGFIAATALVRGLTVVTRNVRDFAFLGDRVMNPWGTE